MLRIYEKGEEIIIRDIALAEFIQRGLMIFSMSYLLFFKASDSINFFFSSVALVLLIASIYNLSFVQTKTVKINKQKRIVSINNRSLVKNTTHIYRFGEIADLISVETLTDKNDKKSYQLVFPLETGERIEISRSFSSGKDKYFEAVDVVNNLIFDNPKKIPQSFTGFNKF